MSVGAIATGAFPTSHRLFPTDIVSPPILLGVDRTCQHRHGFSKGQEVRVEDDVRVGGVYYGGWTGRVVGFTHNKVVVQVGGDGEDMIMRQVAFLSTQIHA